MTKIETWKCWSCDTEGIGKPPMEKRYYVRSTKEYRTELYRITPFCEKCMMKV